MQPQTERERAMGMSALDALKLPWELQVSLASGYAAYLLAYSGIRGRHTAIDTAFVTLLFGLVATFTLAAAKPLGDMSALLAFAVACLVGFLWRRVGRSWYSSFVRWSNLSWSNDDASALATLSDNSGVYVSQIAVLLDDGTWLCCDDTALFANSPFGPAQIGSNGDIALYLTHEFPLNGERTELKSVKNSYYGDRITYIPASRIKRLTFRYMQA